jgi:LysM repeat protein
MKMTRENKLALVVGFGLMLFVGILISDHFSTARNQEAADIRSGRLVDPLAQSRHDNALLIETVSRAGDDSSGRRTGPLAMNPTQIPAPQDSGDSTRAERRIEPTPPRNEIPRIVMGGNNAVGGATPGQTNAENFVFHHVQSGESLIAIARRHYGDDSLARELARFNEIDNPNTIRVGHRLRIPPAEVLRGGNDATAEPAAAAAADRLYHLHRQTRRHALGNLARTARHLTPMARNLRAEPRCDSQPRQPPRRRGIEDPTTGTIMAVGCRPSALGSQRSPTLTHGMA